MRYHLLVLILMAGVAMPATAQQSATQTQQIGRRLDRIEQELRAVQRRVFPGGNVEPEISSAQPQAGTTGLPASSPVADLNARVDALESQLAALTGQAEANENRIRQAEEALRGLRETVVARLDALEGAAPARQAAAGTSSTTAPAAGGTSGTSAATTRTNTPTSGGSAATTTVRAAASTALPADAGEAEEAYNVGYRLWDQRRYAEARDALTAMTQKYPRSRFVSFARNLTGRAFLDEGKYASAARALLSNYQEDPRGERAADSLFFLGQALVKLNKQADACKAYDELQDVYGETMRAWLKERLPAARSEARCR